MLPVLRYENSSVELDGVLAGIAYETDAQRSLSAIMAGQGPAFEMGLAQVQVGGDSIDVIALYRRGEKKTACLIEPLPSSARNTKQDLQNALDAHGVTSKR